MIKFDNSYIQLPTKFYTKQSPVPRPKAELIAFNYDLAKKITGTDFHSFSKQEITDYFSGSKIFNDGCYISMAYAGHQFGHFNPQLGDGRAMLLGEVVHKDKRHDIVLKGSGPTHFSRGGDGNSALGPVLREYIVSEAMHALGVPTTRALCAIDTNQSVYRQSIEPGGVFTRVSKGHIRIGTFEFFAAQGDYQSIEKLTHHCISRFYPEVLESDNIYLAFLKQVATLHSDLVAKWMALGFIHGVLNTDNISICGETIDYGPCAFMDDFHSDKVFSSIDRGSRYSYSNQVNIMKWNLSRLASCLIPLIDESEQKAIAILEESINSYLEIYENKVLKAQLEKIGITIPNTMDKLIIQKWHKYMQDNELDYTISHHHLQGNRAALIQNDQLIEFLAMRDSRIKQQAQSQGQDSSATIMKKVNPIYIPRNHQIQKCIDMAYDENDYTLFHELNTVLKDPFTQNDELNKFRVPPKKDEVVKETFCGT